QEALRRFDPTQETYSNMGLLYARQKKYEKAELFFRKALEINPQNEGVWVNLGHTLSEMSSPDKKREAISAYQSVTQEMYDRLRLDTIVTRLEYELQN
ncbi:MAG: tetratricopeptide repeat protein, partial [Candidatus Zixiibacteriota bacterium]